MSVFTGSTAANAKITPMLRNMFATIFLFIDYPSFPSLFGKFFAPLKKRCSSLPNLLLTGNPVEQNVFTMVLLFLENLARESESRGFTRGGLDGWGFGVYGMLSRSLIASQEKMKVGPSGRTCVIRPNR